MNVIISERATRDVIGRYEVHLAGEGEAPPDEHYFDDAWQKAIEDRVVDAAHRERYAFELQRPKTLYESSV
jgi:hypothetical protein